MFLLVLVGLEVFDLIDIDAPPLLGLAYAPLLSNAKAAKVFVVGAGQPRKGDIRLALRRQHQALTDVIGCVKTMFNAKAVGYNDGLSYGYGHGDGYGYGAEALRYGGPPPASEAGTEAKPQLARSA